MNLQRRNWVLSSLAMGLTGPSSVWAQSNWPDKPIRVISAGTPGGSSDIFVHIIENRMKDKLGQPLYIDNKPGAGGMTAAGLASVAPPNGLTLFVSNLATNAIGVSLYSKPTFNSQRDLPPVARLVTKGRHARTVFISAKLRAELQAYAHQAKCVDRSYPFFASQKSIRAGFNANSLAQTFALLYEGAGLEGASSHSGRRTFLTNLANKGTAIHILKTLAGHRSISTTAAYLYSSPSQLKAAVELV